MLNQTSRVLWAAVFGAFFPLGKLEEVCTSVSWGIGPEPVGLLRRLNVIACVTQCLTKQWLLLYYGGGGWNIQECILLTQVMDKGELTLDANGFSLEQRKADPLIGLAHKAWETMELWHIGEHSSHRSTEWGEPISEPSQETCPDYRWVYRWIRHCSGLVHPYTAPSWNTVGEAYMTESNAHILFQILSISQVNPQLLLKCSKKLNTIFPLPGCSYW